MDTIILFLANSLGLNPVTLPLYLGILVAVANLVGKSIPASATGTLGIVRKICLVIGLYIPQQITSSVSTKNVAEAIAASVPDSSIRKTANALPDAISLGMNKGSLASELADAARRRGPTTDAFREGATRSSARSPAIVGLLSLFLLALLAACSTAQKERVTATVAAICTSAPLAQALYNSAIESNDQNRVNQILNYLQATCPAVVILIQQVPVKPLIVEPAITPERG